MPQAATLTAESFSWAALLAGRRPLVMGVVNVTPDSFSDGGRYLDADRARAHAAELAAEGADILDVGAESTRPYGDAKPVDAAEEIRRLAPLPEIVALGTPVSIDTMKAEVARWALDRGAVIVNDVWGLQRDADMAPVVAERRAGLVIMHNRESVDPAIEILDDIRLFFSRSLEIAARAGVAEGAICLDPGIGFGKTPEQSIETLARLADLESFGLPLLVGASRKRFIHSLSPSAPGERIGGSLASHLWAADQGAAVVRVHDVFATAQALRVAAALRRASCRT